MPFHPGPLSKCPSVGREGRKHPAHLLLPGCHRQVQHTLPQGQENAETRELNLAPSTSRISKQLPWGQQPLPPPPGTSQLPGPQAGGCLLTACSPRCCKLPLPRHDRCSCYSVCSSQDKSLSRSTKPAGTQTGSTSIETTCQGPCLPHPPMGRGEGGGGGQEGG